MPHILKLVVLLQVATSSINAIPVGGQLSRCLLNCGNPFKSVTKSRIFDCLRSDPESESAPLIDGLENYSGGTWNNAPESAVGQAINVAERPAAGLMKESASSHLEASSGSVHHAFEQGTTSAQNPPGIDDLQAPGKIAGHSLKEGTASPHTTQEMDAKNAQCAVCYKDLGSKNVIGYPSCNHPFHEACLNSWIQINNSCPTCRNMVGTSTSNAHPLEPGLMVIGPDGSKNYFRRYCNSQGVILIPSQNNFL